MDKNRGFILMAVLCYLTMMTLLALSGWQQAQQAIRVSQGFKSWMQRQKECQMSRKKVQ